MSEIQTLKRPLKTRARISGQTELKKKIISNFHGLVAAQSSITTKGLSIKTMEFKDKLESIHQKQATWSKSDACKKLSDACTSEDLSITLFTIYGTSIYKAAGKRFAEYIAMKLYKVYRSNHYLKKAAQERGLPDDYFIPTRREHIPQTVSLTCNYNETERPGDMLKCKLEDYAKVILMGMGKRGSAAINQEGAWRGFICRQLNQSLPNNIPNRYATIAELALLAGISVTRVQARSLIMKGRT